MIKGPLHEGGSAGFIVLTRSGEFWRDDWDGDVHPDLVSGARELCQARAAGCDAVLVELHRVAEFRIESPEVEVRA